MKIKILPRERIESDPELSAIAATEEYKLPDGAYGKCVDVIAEYEDDYLGNLIDDTPLKYDGVLVHKKLCVLDAGNE